jgi:hypothetical protein
MVGTALTAPYAGAGPGWIDEGNVTGAKTIAMLNVDEVHVLHLTGAATITLGLNAAAQVGVQRVLRVLLAQDATGGRTVSWATSINWLSGAAPNVGTPGAIDIVELLSPDGTTWYGFTGSVVGNMLLLSSFVHPGETHHTAALQRAIDALPGTGVIGGGQVLIDIPGAIFDARVFVDKPFPYRVEICALDACSPLLTNDNIDPTTGAALAITATVGAQATSAPPTCRVASPTRPTARRRSSSRRAAS